MSMVLFAYSNYPRVSQVIDCWYSVDYMLHFGGKRHEWSNVEIFVQCLSLLRRNMRSYRTPWTWRGTWGQKQRTLPEQWVFFTVALNAPLIFCVWWFSLCCFVPCNNVPLLSSIWEWGISILLVVHSSDGGRAKEAEEAESDPDAGLLAQSSSTDSPQPDHHTDPGSGDTEAGAPETGMCIQQFPTQVRKWWIQASVQNASSSSMWKMSLTMKCPHLSPHK